MTSELRPAMAVWVDAEAAYNDALQKPKTLPNKAAAAVIEAYAAEREEKAWQEAWKEAKREGMQVLLPPGSVDSAEYLEGWCEGQAYLIANYGTEEAFAQAAALAEQAAELAKWKALAETLAGALEPLIEQCWSCEKELTEEYYGVHYSGESAPLDDARETLRQYKEARDA